MVEKEKLNGCQSGSPINFRMIVYLSRTNFFIEVNSPDVNL
jgi:hypothetical protein